MGKTLSALLMAVVAVAFFGCAAKESGKTGAQRTDVVYFCDCGPTCTCNSVATEPGKCACGKPLKWGHVVRIEGNEALVCTCQEGCVCTLDPNNPAKCLCGGEIKRISLEKTGLYFCNCGGACNCNVVSGQPGQCRCGMNLKSVN